MSDLRFFISYSHKDHDLAALLVNQLRAEHHHVWFDEMLAPGRTFPDQIKQKIQRCHFFIPLITSNSQTSVWVQQEIGYSLACNVMVVPMAFGRVPDETGMITNIQYLPSTKKALFGNSRNSRRLNNQLKKVDWNGLLQRTQEGSRAVFQISSNHLERSTLLTDNAQGIVSEFEEATVMQKSTLTSFSLPKHLDDSYWEPVRDRKELFWFRPEERTVMDRLLDQGGCRLIIDPCYAKADYRLDVYRAKLQTLKEFCLGHLDDSKTQVVVRQFDQSESEVIIGDHWMAHSAAVGTMVAERETISTWHAPTVRRYADTFQREFDDLFDRQDEPRGNRSSAEYSIDWVDCRIRHLKNASSVPERCQRCKLVRKT